VDLSLDMSLKLQQKLSFQMIQSLKLLQVNTVQLEQLLKNELEMNPVLEAAEDADAEQESAEEQNEEPAADKEEDELDVNEDSVDWEEYLEDGFEMSGNTQEETDPNREYYEPSAVQHVSLDEYLEQQLSEKKITERQKLLMQFLIGCLDEDGYLRIDPKEIANVTQTDLMEVAEAIQMLRSFEPPGIGSRNLQECFLMQLRAKYDDGALVMRIVAEAWELLEKWKLPEIARTFNVTIKDVQDAVDIIKTLHPRPGSLVSGEKTTTIVPDLIVESIDGEFVVMLNDRSVPMLHINKSYANMLRRGSSVRKEVKTYVRDKLNSAVWLIRSIEQRRSTMLKVMHAIVDRQREFFENGPSHLLPLKLQDIADMIGMHISTVSRVTSNKYVQTQHGIFELKYFFTESMGHDASNGDVSSESIRKRIQELIGNENSKKPLSDQKISDILSREKLEVARRTVAKYREQMKILPARLRQKYE
jgi:RNA polymerase sigma-54 factor